MRARCSPSGAACSPPNSAASGSACSSPNSPASSPACGGASSATNGPASGDAGSCAAGGAAVPPPGAALKLLEQGLSEFSLLLCIHVFYL